MEKERFKKHECVYFLGIRKAKYMPDGKPLPCKSVSYVNIENMELTEIVAILNVKIKNPNIVEETILKHKAKLAGELPFNNSLARYNRIKAEKQVNSFVSKLG